MALADAAKLYDTLHPGIYRYSTPDEFDRRYAAHQEELRPGASLAEAFLAFTHFSVIGRRFLVTDATESSHVPRHDEIVTIDGRPGIARFMTSVLVSKRSEGATTR